MNNKFEIKTDSISGVRVLYLSGQINAFSDKDISETYEEIEFDNIPKLIVNFENIEYINSAGVATLIGIVTDIVRKKGILKFVGLAPHYKRVVEIVGITDYVGLHDTVEEALGEIQ